MKYLIYKSLKQFKIYKRREFNYFKYRILLGAEVLPMSLRFPLMLKFKRFSSKRVRFKRRCVVTGFNRSFRRLSFSRMVFREFASYGYFNGIRKASW